ncbi:MAG: DUF4031 domain-containing protein [Bacteroidia bacterium]|nr:DUF4031 domain-containing protein [Bacteroidia bacterium]MDW8332904.1 DUF4031 domain-containing protein [Bacteroidia bacterium]
MVYVDTPRKVFFKGRECTTAHCTADTLEELHAFARSLGVPSRCFENKPGKPHYDLFDDFVELARRSGALMVERKVFVAIIRLRYGSNQCQCGKKQ